MAVRLNAAGASSSIRRIPDCLRRVNFPNPHAELIRALSSASLHGWLFIPTQQRMSPEHSSVILNEICPELRSNVQCTNISQSADAVSAIRVIHRLSDTTFNR